MLIIQSLNIQVKILTTLVKQIYYKTSAKLISILRNKNIIEILENEEFKQIQKVVDTFIENKDRKSVEVIEKGKLEWTKPKVKKVKF